MCFTATGRTPRDRQPPATACGQVFGNGDNGCPDCFGLRARKQTEVALAQQRCGTVGLRAVRCILDRLARFDLEGIMVGPNVFVAELFKYAVLRTGVKKCI